MVCNNCIVALPRLYFVLTEAVEEYFKQFGEIDDVVVKVDDYGKSRCFAFVKFKDVASAKQVRFFSLFLCSF